MVFDGLKSEKALSREIRDWCYNENLIVMGAEHAYNMRGYVYENSIIEVATDVMERAYSSYTRNKAMGRLTGERGSISENLRYLKGIQLVQKLARKKGWRLIKNGSPAYGYRFEIIEMPD
jgi:hypothetical protein